MGPSPSLTYPLVYFIHGLLHEKIRGGLHDYKIKEQRKECDRKNLRIEDTKNRKKGKGKAKDTVLYRSRIHDLTILLRFLGIILRVLRLMGFLNHMEGGMVLYQVFLNSPLQYTVTEL